MTSATSRTPALFLETGEDVVRIVFFFLVLGVAGLAGYLVAAQIVAWRRARHRLGRGPGVCAKCDGPLERERRRGWQRLVFRAVERCSSCGRRVRRV